MRLCAMCLSVPGRVIAVEGPMAEIEREGRRGWFNALAQPEVKAGDFVLTYANLVIAIISQDDAQAMVAAGRELMDLLDREEAAHEETAMDGGQRPEKR